MSRPRLSGNVTIWLDGFGPHHFVKAPRFGTPSSLSAGTTARYATTPVNSGDSGPNRPVRTTEWMPSAPMSTSTSSCVPSANASRMGPGCALPGASNDTSFLPSAIDVAGTACSSACNRSARCIVSCGAPYFVCAVRAISRREVSSPESQVRLMRWLGCAADWRKASPTPRPSSARTALGVRLMSAPTRANCAACSYTRTRKPARSKPMAAARPPMPAPLMPMRGACMGTSFDESDDKPEK